MLIAPLPERNHQEMAPDVIRNEHSHQCQFRMQPAEVQVSGCGHYHGDAKYGSHGRPERHHLEQSPLHDYEALETDLVGGHYVINEQPRQIKQAGEPGDDEDHVKSFEPEHTAAKVLVLN